MAHDLKSPRQEESRGPLAEDLLARSRLHPRLILCLVLCGTGLVSFLQFRDLQLQPRGINPSTAWITLTIALVLAAAATAFLVSEQHRTAKLRLLIGELQREAHDLRENEPSGRAPEREQAEPQIQLEEARKLQALGQLAGSIAHDFNNYLSIIMNNCQIARMDIVHGHPAVQSLELISDASRRASAIVRQILAFIRNQPQERRELNPVPVVRGALNLLRSMIPENVQLEETLHPESPAILANVEQIHQAVLNLGTNALHAMSPAGGRLETRLEPVSVDENLARQVPNLRPGPYARLTVSDTGHGMDAATAERIFDPLFTTKRPGQGTGLGLSILQDIMKNHHGAISVRSQPGCGAVFQLYFPAVAESAGPPGSQVAAND